MQFEHAEESLYALSNAVQGDHHDHVNVFNTPIFALPPEILILIFRNIAFTATSNNPPVGRSVRRGSTW